MKRTEKNRAIVLRLKGHSYNEIKKILKIPSKGTLSYWFKNLSLPARAKERLKNNIEIARKRGLFKYNFDRTEAIEVENKSVQKDAENEIGKLSSRELLLIGAALYWGEGTKSEKNKNALRVALTNSDPQLVSLFMRFVREILGVDDEKIRAEILIHSNVDIKRARIFWAEVTKLPMDRFYITNQLSRASKLKRPKNLLPFGTISIRINKRILFFKIKGYISGLRKNIK